jgi:large subunit ribosomal protein L20
MTRVKRGNIAKKRRKKILYITKGFRGSHSKLFRTANQQRMKALQRSYFDRKKKKRNFKALWIKRINATSKNLGTSYNKFINLLKRKKIILNKKILAEIAIKDVKILSDI